MKKNVKLLLLLPLAAMMLAVGCGTQKHAGGSQAALDASPYGRLADSILQVGLDNEALFTLLGDMKPMSSLLIIYAPVANDDREKAVTGKIVDRATQGVYIDKFEKFQQAINSIDLPDLKIVSVPYIGNQRDLRMVQLSVVRVSLLDKLLKEHEEFFAQFGLVPGADPNVVVVTIENAPAYERWRGYGYLFGYPDYAVDFYVQASLENEKTGKFVERDFFRMDTYAAPGQGNFVYAYPKGHKPTADVDSVLYYKAGKILQDYKQVRDKYLYDDQKSVQARKLILEAGAK